jgi:hydroxyacyl-ACP dehydratase HTD2-like protein with hotdog domain
VSALLTERHLAHIGRADAPRTEVVTRRDIRKYAVATSQLERRFLDGDEAPPLFHMALFWDVVEQHELTEDGVSRDRLIPELPLTRAMAGGLKVAYHRTIRPGDVLTARRTLTNLYEKAGRSGALIFYEVVMEVTTEDGAPVLTETTTRILR